MPIKISAENSIGGGGSGGGDNSLANRVQTTGLLSDGAMAVVGLTTVLISAGTGVVIDSSVSTANPTVTPVAWSNMLEVTVTNFGVDGTTLFAFDSLGVLNQFDKTLVDIETYRDFIVIGEISYKGGINILDSNNAPGNLGYDSTLASVEFIRDVVGPVNQNGNIVSANGANFNIDITSGELFSIGANFHTDPNSPNTAPISVSVASSFGRFMRNTAGAAHIISGGITQIIDPTLYDDGSGTLADPGNKVTIQRVYRFLDGAVGVAYGQNFFDDVDKAQVALLLGGDPFVELEPLKSGVLVGYILVKKDADDLQETNKVRFLRAPKMKPDVWGISV